MRLGAIGDRLYADFAMPSRLPAYRAMLRTMLDAGYRIWSIEGFWRAIRDDGATPEGRHVVVRHDVDTDPRTAAAMWAIDRSLGVVGSYYFRLSTIDAPLMRDIVAGGGEASYHYEELATLAKRHGIDRPEDARRRIPEAQARFRANLTRLRASVGVPMSVVASHGDFVNRHLGIPNTAVLADLDFRASVGVELEAYDEAFAGRATSRSSDTLHPRYWIPEDPLDAVRRGEPVISLLVHPRHWYARRVANAVDDVGRVGEDVAYRARAWLRRR